MEYTICTDVIRHSSVTYSGEDVVNVGASPPIVTVLGSAVNIGLLPTSDNAANIKIIVV